MDIRLHLAALVLVFAGMPAAAAPPRATAEFSNGRGLEIRFDQPMLTWQQAGALDTLRIEPRLDCIWSWRDDEVLSCGFPLHAEDPRLATPYAVQVGRGFWSQAGEELAPVRLILHSKLPEIEADGVEWRDGQALFRLSTKAKVGTAELQRVLRLDAGGARGIALSLEPQAAAHGLDACQEDYRCWIARSSDATLAGELMLHIEPGLRSDDGPLPGVQAELLARAFQHEPFRLRRWSCGRTQPPCAAGDLLVLEFSHAPDAPALQRWLTQLPPGLAQDRSGGPVPRGMFVGAPTLETEADWRLALRVERAQQDFRLTVPAWLTAANGRASLASDEIAFRSGDFQPSLDLPHPRLLLRPGDPVPVLGSVRNMPARQIVERRLDASGLQRMQAELLARPDNRSHPLQPLQVPGRLRREGGLVFGEVVQQSPYWQPQSYAIAYAPFHVAALRTSRQLLLWASEWKGFVPRAGVEMEVLQATPAGVLQPLAQARTGQDGSVLLDLPTLPKSGVLFLRARSSRETSVMPLEDLQPFSRRYDTVAEGGLMFWGVSDRPLYRPGDRVNFRAWLRAREANHLRAAPKHGELTLRLGGEHDTKVLQEQSLPLDSSGAVSGDAVLPSVLPDGRYCLAPVIEVNGELCFDVQNYHAAALWAELKTAQRLLHDKDMLHLTAEAGFYSGGPAADAQAELQSLLTPLRLQDEYPEFAQFEFVDPYLGTRGEGGERLAEEYEKPVRLDQQGRHDYALVIDSPPATDFEQPIPFGKLELSVAVATSSASYVSSSALVVRVSRFRRFVGLQLAPGLGLAQDPELTAVVIDAQGRRVSDAAPVVVTLQAAPVKSTGGEETRDGEILARCELVPDKPQRCPLRAPAAGHYRFVARSGDAAPATLERYIGGGEAVPKPAAGAELLRLDGDGEGRAKIVLRQPFARAKVLFAVQHGLVLRHWTALQEGAELAFELDLPPDWAPGVSLSAVIYDATAQARPLTAELELAVAAPPRPSPLQIELPQTAKPGEEILLRLRNRSAAPLAVTLALADESVRLQAADILAQRDPQAPGWLGALQRWQQGRRIDLADWQGSTDWIASWESLLAPDEDGGDTLERIEVTGSRIVAADLFAPGAASDRNQRPAPRRGVTGAALRSRFADTAYWQAALPLEAGAEQELRLRLPDNLTRWQLSAWTVQGDDGFYYDEAAVRASLPLELRAEAPARLYPGDHARVAAAVRNNSAAAANISAQLRLEGAGIAHQVAREQVLAPAQEFRLVADAAPQAAGELSLQAQAQSGAAGDGLGLQLPVAGVEAAERLTVAGWLGSAPLQLQLPPLPSGAREARLSLRAGRGVELFAAGWITGLRDYLHRCWEQSLSRAVGAAAALRLERLQNQWPQADSVIKDVLAQAPVFQEHGLFVFFLDEFSKAGDGNVLLTAYSVQALQTLASWGHAADAAVLRNARETLAAHLTRVAAWKGEPAPRVDWHEVAAVLAALAGDARFDELVRRADQHWDELDVFARSRLLLAMQARPGAFPQLAQRHAALREAAPLQAGRRVLRSGIDRGAWMGSDLRDQCGLIGALQQLDPQDPELPAWRRGLGDLYAGGSGSVDTQAAAQCLMTFAALPPHSAADARIVLDYAGRHADVAVPAQPEDIAWTTDLAPAARTLQVQAAAGSDDLNFVAEASYLLDQRASRAVGIGLSVQRSYAVLRGGEWQPVPEARFRAGEWVRVALQLHASAPRHHVALVDQVPGGLRPEQFELDRVGGVELRDSGGGSWLFGTRQQSDTDVRFYAERLPPGDHVVYYYARAAHRGDYFAAPATAELMYGGVGTARTAPQRIKIGD